MTSALANKDFALLIPDRSLSTFGRRLLKSLRVRETQWPMSGVFSFPELAKKILAEKKINVPEKLSRLLQFAIVVDKRPETSISELFEEFKIAEKILKIAPSAQIVAQIIANSSAADSSEGPQLSQQSSGALYSALILLGENRILNDFQIVEMATQELTGEAINWHRILERAPGADITLATSSFRQLLPAEKMFFEKISQQKTIRITNVLEIPPETSHTIDVKKLSSSKRFLEDCDLIIWANTLTEPGPLEAQALTGSTKPFNLALSDTLRTVPREKNEFEKKLKESSESKALQISELLDKFCENKKLNSLENKLENQKELLKILTQRLSQESTEVVLKITAELGLFTLREERELPFSESPTSPTLISLEDFPILALKNSFQKAAYWGDPKSLEQLLSSRSFIESKKALPDDLEKALLSEGLPLPSIYDEHHELCRLLNHYHFAHKTLDAETSSQQQAQAPHSNSINFLKAKTVADFQTSTQSFSLNAQQSTRVLSPSGVETFSRCPLQFHYSRELRLGQYEIPDDLSGSPMRKGNLIHKVLEKIDLQDPKSVSVKLIEKILNDEVAKAYEGFASAAYLGLLKSQLPQWAEALNFYIQIIEKKLFDLFPRRKIESEKEFRFDWNKNITLRGRIDRLDFTGESYFLWDYKSGSFHQSTFERHLENGKFQWLLYAESLARMGMPLAGGGYLNPLELKKSRLLFFGKAESLLGHEFFDALKDAGVRFDILDEAKHQALSQKLIHKMETILAELKNQERPARPLKKEECQRCSFEGLCSYRYGVSL